MKIPTNIPFRLLHLPLLLGALWVSGCINSVNEGERPCPCDDGWTCCPDANVCVADAYRCVLLQVPSAPRALAATTEPGVVVLTWSEPERSGGSTLSGYQVDVTPREDGVRIQVSGNSARVTGLRTGGTYRFTVAALNAGGAGSAATLESVKLPDVPSAPMALSVSRGNLHVHVTWSAPASDGGLAILHYVVTAHPSGISIESEGPALAAEFHGLPNGVATTVTVRAVNAAGTGLASEESQSVVPAAVPGPPVSVAATPGVRAATLSWQPPENTGGLPLSGYVVTAVPGGATRHVEATTTEATFTNLQDDTEYTFHLAAMNEVGRGPSHYAASVRTHAPPGAPLSVRAEPGARSFSVSWEPPTSDGRSTITGYTVVAQPSGVRLDVGPDARGVLLENVPSTKAQTLSVTARNAVGPGAAATAGAPVRTSPAPVEVTQLDAATDDLGCQRLSYALRQVDGERADVLVEFDAEGTGTFTRATQAPTTYDARDSGLVAIATSAEGKAHTFRWNRPRDVSEAAASAQLRITAVVPGSAPATRTRTVALATAARRCEVELGPSIVQQAPPSTMELPNSVALGDFNRDGHLDLAVLVSSSRRVHILRGLGSGYFERHQPALPDPMDGRHLISADLDQDGALDLISTATSHLRLDVTVARGDGTGFFTTPVRSYLNREETHPSISATPVASDMDGDGIPEIVVPSSSGIVVLRHVGGGRLEEAFSGSPRSDISSYAAVTGDFNNDGHMDIMHAGAGPIAYYGLGSLAFREERLGTPLWGITPVATTADFNGDGHLDIVAWSRSDLIEGNTSTIELLLNDGNGRFLPPVQLYQHSWDILGDRAHLIAADLDGNGTQDIAYVSSASASVTLLHGRGDGTFELQVILSGLYQTSLVAADFDGSGKPDLAVLSSWQGNIRLFRDAEVPTQLHLGRGSVTADFDGDGRDDVASLVENRLQIHLTRAGGELIARSPIPLEGQTWKLLPGRFDAGPTTDLLVLSGGFGRPNLPILLLRGNGDGTFSEGEVIPMDAVFMQSGSYLAATGDIDGDGDLDVVINVQRDFPGGTATEVRLLLNQGDGTFMQGEMPATFHSSIEQLGLGDLNQDGRADLVVLRRVSPGFELVVFTGNANGTLSKVREYAPGGDSCWPRGVAFADLDLDGHVDLAVSCEYVGVIPMFGLGDFQFFARRGVLPVGDYVTQIAARDLDGDGFPELIVSDDQLAVCVLPSWGRGEFGPGNCFGTLNATHQFALIDIDHDGTPEVLAGARYSNSYNVSTLLRLR